MGLIMTDTSVSTRFTESDFRVGRVLNRTTSVLSRNFLTFFIVTAVASIPLVVLKGFTDETKPGLTITLALVSVLLAVVLYGAFQDMRGRPVSLSESLKVGMERFFPIIGLAIIVSILVGLASILLIVPGLILFTMWFVATPVCVVERLGPNASMRRSTQLTKGHRWKVFGLILLLVIISAVVSPLIEFGLAAVAGSTVALVGSLIWNGVWGAFYAISVVVTYHDLRVAKEGI